MLVLELKSIVNEHCCPFDGAAIHILKKDSEAVTLLNDLYLLYEKVNYKFSSPGNSFERNVCYDLSRSFHVQKWPEKLRLPEIDSALKNEYQQIIEQLLSKAVKLKFRTL